MLISFLMRLFMINTYETSSPGPGPENISHTKVKYGLRQTTETWRITDKKTRNYQHLACGPVIDSKRKKKKKKNDQHLDCSPVMDSKKQKEKKRNLSTSILQ